MFVQLTENKMIKALTYNLLVESFWQNGLQILEQYSHLLIGAPTVKHTNMPLWVFFEHIVICRLSGVDNAM